MSSFANRIVTAANLDVSLYEEVEADKQALGQAMGAVALPVWQPVSGVPVRRDSAGCRLESLLPLPGGLSGR